MSPWSFCERAYSTVFNTPNAMQESHLAPVQPTTDGQTEGLIEGKREGRFTQLVPIWYVVRVHLQFRPPTVCQFYAKMMQELVSNLEGFYHRKARSVKCYILQGLHFVCTLDTNQRKLCKCISTLINLQLHIN